MTMIEDKGADYVTAWPRNIANRYSLSVEHVIDAINTVTGSNIPRHRAYSVNAPLAEVGALTGETARDVVTEVRRISTQLSVNATVNCHTCGLPVRNGQCTECV